MGSSSKSSGESKSYNYYGTIAGVICEGRVDALLAIHIDGKEAWPMATKWTAANAVALNQLRSYDGSTWKCILAHTSSTLNAPPHATYWQEYSLLRSGDYSSVTVEGRGEVRIYWGTSTQTADPLLSTGGNEFGEDHPDYKGICYAVLVDFLFGREKTSAPNVEFVVRRAPNQSVITGAPSELSDGQANLMAAAVEMLVSGNGLGLIDVGLSDASFVAAAAALHDRASLTACSPLIESQMTIREFLDEIAGLTDVGFRFVDNVIYPVLYAHGAAPSATTITTDDLAEVPSIEAEGWDDVSTRAVVQYHDRKRAFKQTSDKAEDSRAYRVLGEHRQVSLSRPWITRRAQAIAHALETLRTVGRPQITASIVVVRAVGNDLLAGNYVLLDIDLEPGGAQLLQYFRIAEILRPAFGPVTLKLEAEETIAPIPWNSGDVPVVEPPPLVPEIVNYRVIETPPAIADADTVCILAERPDALIVGFEIAYDWDVGGLFPPIGAAGTFATRATLRTAISSVATTTIELTVPDQVDLDRMTEQPGELGAEDDQMLLIIVGLQTAGAVGQIRETSDKYPWVEVCSIISSTLVSGTSYDIEVKRGRLGTAEKDEHLTASSEVWIIPRSGLAQVTHGDFAIRRGNRFANVLPYSGFFMIAPFTFAAQREFADVAQVEYIFTPSQQVGPTLTITAPATSPHAVSSTYPNTYTLEGLATDPNANVIGLRIIRTIDGGAEELIYETVFAPTDEFAFAQDIIFEEEGSHLVTIMAYDNLGLFSEQIIEFTAPAGAAKVATPYFWANGRKLRAVEEAIYGPIEIRCDTPGVTIKYGPSSGSITTVYHWMDHVSPSYPVGWHIENQADLDLWAGATKPGMANSASVHLRILLDP